MKFVQVGILIALIVVGVLLFQVYRGQQREAAVVPATTDAPTAAAAPAAPIEAIPVQPAPSQTPQRAASRPSPARAAKASPDAEPPAPPIAAQPEPVAASTPQPAPAPEPAPVARAVPAEPAAPPPPPQPRSVTLTTGTLLSARLSQTLSTDKVKEGDSFTATLDKPLVVDGLVIAERGARVDGTVVESQEAGRVRGVSSLSIRLVRLLTSDGQRLEIQTDAFRKEGETSRKEDAAKVGGGAGLGAVIGAIAGGGKGAAIGAAIGGAAGAGTVAATRGKAAVLPVETRIDFRINQPVTITEKK